MTAQLSLRSQISTYIYDNFPYPVAYARRLIKKGPNFSCFQKGAGSLDSPQIWTVEDRDHTAKIFIPYLRRYAMYCSSVKARIEYMRERYFMNSLDLKDALILDVGAHIGEFAISVAPFVKKVVCFEPDPVALKALQLNTKAYENIEIKNVALSNRDGLTTLYVATSKADTSLFEPECYQQKIEVNAFCLDSILSPTIFSDYKNVYLKMDAEGFEPEVLEGANNWLQILSAVSIDVAPEREGKDTYDEVKRLLEAAGLIEKSLSSDYVLHASRR